MHAANNTKKFNLFYFTFLIILIITFPVIIQAQDDIPYEDSIASIKRFNFVVTTLGVLSFGIDQDKLDKLYNLQFAMPRQLRILVTQSNMKKELFRDFTFLVNQKDVEAILIWPSEEMEDKNIIKKICTMSKKKKIPIFVMQEGWTEQGAMVEFKSSGTTTVIVNEQVRSYMNFPIAENDYYSLVQK